MQYELQGKYLHNIVYLIPKMFSLTKLMYYYQLSSFEKKKKKKCLNPSHLKLRIKPRSPNSKSHDYFTIPSYCTIQLTIK